MENLVFNCNFIYDKERVDIQTLGNIHIEGVLMAIIDLHHMVNQYLSDDLKQFSYVNKAFSKIEGTIHFALTNAEEIQKQYHKNIKENNIDKVRIFNLKEVIQKSKEEILEKKYESSDEFNGVDYLIAIVLLIHLLEKLNSNIGFDVYLDTLKSYEKSMEVLPC